MTAKTKTASSKVTKATKATKAAKSKPAESTPPTAAPLKKMSALNAASKVLTESGEPMNAKAMIGAMGAKGYWTSPGGKTPHATLYAAILREIGVKGDASRFRRATKGHFAAAGVAKPAIPKATMAPKATPAAKAPKAPTASAKAKARKAEPAAIPDGTPGPKSMSDMFRL